MKRIKHAGLILCSILIISTLCGCDLFAGVNLTKEESELIAEYAAGLLRKYDTNGKLKDLAEEEPVEEVEEIPEEPESVEEVESAEPVEEIIADDVGDTAEVTVSDGVEPDFYDITEGMDVVDASEEAVNTEEVSVSDSSIASLLNVSGYDISYSGYELCDKYPENDDDSWLISMTSKEGKKLCVLKFAIANNSGSGEPCDILNSGKSYRLIVNDSKRINETVTVLMDSFSQFNETLSSGDSCEAVLVFEMDNELAESINSLKLIIKDKDNSDTVELE